MKLLAGIAFLGLAASVSTARATPFDFTYSGRLVDFTAPITDTYQILAFGAQGGTVSFVGPGGRGAEIGGDFSLTAGEILQIAVGGAGSDTGGVGAVLSSVPGTPLW
jgi:hypothetical protein